MDKLKDGLLFNIENIFLNNLTRVSFYLIFLIILLKLLSIIYKFYFINLEYLFTIIGTIFAFWYGYKKYERDKELEIIGNFKINNNIDNIIINWQIYRILYQKGYLKEYMWDIIEDKIHLLFFKRIGILGFKKFEIDEIQNISIDNSVIIRNLKNYKETEKYFKKIYNLIVKIIEDNIKFYEKLNDEKYLIYITYLNYLQNNLK